MLRFICAILLLSYIVGEVLLVLSGESRWLRLIMSPILFIGIVLVQGIFHGFCMILFISGGRRELQPWEMFTDEEEIQAIHKIESPTKPPAAVLSDTNRQSRHHRWEDSTSSTAALSTISGTTTIGETLPTTNPFGPRNTYEHEPWAQKWNKTPWYKKYTLTFSCGTISQAETAVTKLQAKIVWQSLVVALLISVSFSLALVCIPEINVF